MAVYVESHPGRRPGDWQGYSLDHADYLAAGALRFGVPVEALEVDLTGGGIMVRPRHEEGVFDGDSGK